MKYILMFTLLAASYACKESTSEYDKLLPQDQAYIRNLSSAQCQSKFAATYLNYKDVSDDSWGSTSFQREDGFHQEYLEGTNVISSIDFKVWKTDATDIYFYVTETASSVESSYFLKINRVTNSDIIDDLAHDHCAKKYSLTSSGSSGPLTITQDYTQTNSTNTLHFDHYKDVYTFDFNRPAFLGPFKVTRTITTKTTSGSGGTVVGTAKSYKTTYVAKAFNFTDGVPATDAIYTQKFCEPAVTPAETDTPGNPIHRLYKFPAQSASTATISTTFRFGFNSTCSTGAVPALWNLTI